MRGRLAGFLRASAGLPVLIGLALLPNAATAAPSDVQVNVFVPRLTGPTDLAQNVSTIIVMRLWTQLRHVSTEADSANFGIGRVKWSKNSLEELEPEAARQVGEDSESRLVLWGSADRYGPGVVVQANLTVVPGQRVETEDVGRWTVEYRGARIQLGLPASTFQLSPLVLKKDIVDRYSVPNRMTICPKKEVDCEGVRLTNSFKAIGTDGNWVYLKLTTGEKGWIFLPEISDVRGDLVNFTSGLVAYLRGDFKRSHGYFADVVRVSPPGPLHDGARVLSGMSAARGGDGVAELDEAAKASPFSRFDMQAQVMGRVMSASTTRDEADKRRQLDAARRLLQARRHLFRKTDPWLTEMDKALRAD